ncbi:MAG TPA: putative metal-dependent hydrolase [Vicinamibacterales bacterium]
MDELEKLRYPVGRLDTVKPPATARERAALVDQIADAPAVFRSLVQSLTDAQLDTPYRPGGWTIRQVIHHVPDSHMNAYVRMKLAATEDAPAIRPYEQSRWAELPEAKTGPIAMSLDLLDALHGRWVAFMRALPEPAFTRTFTHPEWGSVSIDRAIATYEWHCRHHAAHIRQSLSRT